MCGISDTWKDVDILRTVAAYDYWVMDDNVQFSVLLIQ